MPIDKLVAVRGGPGERRTERKALRCAPIQQPEQVSDPVRLLILHRRVNSLKGLAQPRVCRGPVGDVADLDRRIARNRLKLVL